MPCKIQIKQNLTQDVETKSNPGFGMSLNNAKKLASEINQEYKNNVVDFFSEADTVSRRINIPSNLVDDYYENESRLEELEARGVQMEDAERAGEEYTDDYLFFNLEQPQVVDSAIQQLESFELFEDRERLCGMGICDYTSRKSTQKLEEVGLNPYPNISGQSLAVTVKSPLGDFGITHYVAATVINGGVYIYDMPQHEFISDRFFGKEGVAVKTAYKPRLIPLTVEDIASNYLLTEKEAINFIESIIERRGNNEADSFKSYLSRNMQNSDEYISQLTSLYENNTSQDRYNKKEQNRELELDRVLNDPLTESDKKRLSSLLTNKFKIRTRQYVPRKDKNFFLTEFLEKAIGYTGFVYDYTEGFETVLEKLRIFLRSEEFSENLKRQYSSNSSNYDSYIDSIFAKRRLFNSFITYVKSEGWDNALNKFDKNQRYEIQLGVPSNYETLSESQRIFRLRQYVQNLDNFISPMGLRMKEGDSRIAALFRENYKSKAKLLKIKNTIDLMKSSNDVDFLFNLLAIEARRQYSYYESQGQQYFQQPGLNQSVANEATISKVKQILDKMGIKIQSLVDYAKGAKLNLDGVNGIADTVRKVIAIAEGKEGESITEEMVHIATEIINTKNPNLITEMISKIGRFKIYKQVYDQYKDNKYYQTKDGKPDIRKIKKEAVDKLLAEMIIYNNQGDMNFPELMQEEDRSLLRKFWDNIMDWFRGMYKSSNIDIFTEVSNIITNESETLSETDLSQNEDVGIFLQINNDLSDVQKDFQRRIAETDKLITKVQNTEPIDPILADTEDASNWYEIDNADGTKRRVKRRVTDRVKRWYNSLPQFRGKIFTEEEKKLNEFKRNNGVKYHNFLETIHGRYFNPDGTRKSALEPRPVLNNQVDKEIFSLLEKYFTELMKRHVINGVTPLVFSEVKIYDPVDDEAGTIDLLIVDADGTTHIYDWKFMSINENAYDVAWYKQGAYNVQLGRYRQILMKNYNVKKMGRNRAVPIAMNLKRVDPKDAKSDLKITGITIGSVDPNKETPLTLTPVSEENESTGYDKLDKVIRTLNSVHRQIGKAKVTTDEEKEFKRERLNILKEAARIAHATLNIFPLIEVLSVMRKEGDFILNDYNTIYKGKSPREGFTNEQLSEFADNMREYMLTAGALASVDDLLSSMIYSDDMIKDAKTKEQKEQLDQRRELLNKVKTETFKIRESLREIDTVAEEFTDKFIGERNLISGLLLPEAIVKGLSKMFRGVSELPLNSLRLLYKLVTNSKAKASQEALGEVNTLLEIKKSIEDKGHNMRQYVKKLYQKDDKNNFINKLIYKFSKDFYTLMDENALEGNRKKDVILQNIDIAGYNKEAGEYLKKRIQYLEKIYDEDSETLTDLIIQERRKYDLNRKDFNGWNNVFIKRHPSDKWLSKEYLELKSDPDLFRLYNFITIVNQEAKEIGYIQNKVANTFLPFIRKSFAESLAWGMDSKSIKNFASSLEIRAGEAGYGEINELSGQIEHSIPKYYTTDFTVQEDRSIDNSDLSEDLFKNLVLYINHVKKYKYLSEVEGQINMVKTVETFKDHLSTSIIGNVVFEGDQPKVESGNEDNVKLLDQFIRVLLYDQKYPLSDSDIPLNVGAVIQGTKKAVNKVAGKEIFSIDENPNPLSLLKTMDTANRAFQLKTLGFEFISGAVNIFGGNIQVATQAGNYFKSSEFLSNEMKLIGNRFNNSEEREAFIQLIDKFMPLKDDPTYDKLKEAGMTTLTQHNFSDLLMAFMREPEQHLEKSVFLTLLDNMMIENGNIVSIREFVKKKYKNRYSSSQEFQRTDKLINEEIEELKRTRSISAIKKIENGQLVIPGFDLNNFEQVQRLTNLTRTISRNATGGLADSDINMMSMSIWTRSMMVFKNWIPKLIDTRFGELRKISDDFSVTINEDGLTEGEKYDIGRVRLWMYVMGTSLRDQSLNVMNILQMNDKGIETLEKMYVEFAENYKKRTGMDFNMSKEDFYDMVRNNLRNQMKEVLLLLSLMGGALAMGFVAPDDDDNKANKNAYRFYQKVIDKFISELSFFYNPVEFQKLLSGSMFPAIGLFSDLIRFISHLTMEISGIDIDDSSTTPEEVRKKAQPIKNGAKMFPITKSIMTYGAIMSEDFAKEFDITIQKESRR